MTIYYKSYNKTKPEVNESNAESAQRSHDLEQEIQRLKAERRKKRKRKKPTPGNIPPNTDKGEDPDEDSNTEMTIYQPTRDHPLPRTYADFLATAPAYSGHPAWNLCSPKEYYLWTKEWEWTPELGHFLPEQFLPLPDTITDCPQHISTLNTSSMPTLSLQLSLELSRSYMTLARLSLCYLRTSPLPGPTSARASTA